jgi:hypothetical protein
MNSYSVGDQVRLSATFTNSAGALTDPTTVTCILKRRYQVTPVSTTYTYAGGTVTKDGTGLYHVDVVPDNEGIWDYRWVATGTVVAAEEGAFSVPNSEFYSSV